MPTRDVSIQAVLDSVRLPWAVTFDFDETKVRRERGRFTKVTGTSDGHVADGVAKDAPADASTVDAAKVEATAAKVEGAADANAAKLEAAGGRGRQGLKKLGAIFNGLVIGGFEAMKDVDEKAKQRYGDKGSKVFGLAKKAAWHYLPDRPYLPPLKEIPGAEFLLSLPIFAVSEVVRLVSRNLLGGAAPPPEPAKNTSKRQQGFLEQAAVRKVRETIRRRVKNELGGGKKEERELTKAIKKVPKPSAETAAPATLSADPVWGMVCEAMQKLVKDHVAALVADAPALTKAFAPLAGKKRARKKSAKKDGVAFGFVEEKIHRNHGQFAPTDGEKGGEKEKGDGKDKAADKIADKAGKSGDGKPDGKSDVGKSGDSKTATVSHHAAESVKNAHADLGEANSILEKAGGRRGIRHIKEAVSFLVTRTAVALHDTEKAIEHRYGKRGGSIVKAAMKVAPEVMPDLPDGLDDMVPGMDLLCSLPVVAVAEATRHVGRLLGLHKKKESEPAPAEEKKGSKRQQKLHERHLTQKAMEKIRQKAKELGVAPGKKIEFSDDENDNDDDVHADIEVMIRKTMKVVMRHYTNWLVRRQHKLAKSLAPLKGHKFWSASRRQDAKFAAEQDVERKTNGQFATTGGGEAGGKPDEHKADAAHEAKVAASADQKLEEGHHLWASVRSILHKATDAAGTATDHVPGVKKLKEAGHYVSGLVAKANAGLAERYGKTAARGMMMGSALIANNPLIAPPWLMVMPGSTLLCALPLIAVAEAVHQGRKVLHSQAVIAFEEPTPPPPEEVETVLQGVWKDYLRWLKTHEDKLREALAPLKGHKLEGLAELSRAAFAGYAERLKRDTVELSADLNQGELTLAEWYGRLAALLTPAPFRAAVAAAGGRPVSATQWTFAESQARTIFSHVGLLASRMENFEEDWTHEGCPRARMYAQVAFTDYQEQRRLVAFSCAATRERRDCGGDCCDECRAIAASGWQPLGQSPAVGDCRCATNCRCALAFDTPDAGPALRDDTAAKVE